MNKIIIIFIFIGAVAILFYVTRNNSVTSPANQAADQSAANDKSLEPKTSEEGPVKVKVTPIDFSENSKAWKFNIVLDTHSVELDYDLTKVVSLFDDQGREYKPIFWEGPKPGGHHIEGILNFNPISPLPKKVEIRMLKIGGVDLRSFIWELK